MTYQKRIAGKLCVATTFILLVFLSNNSFSQDAKALISQNCASCHAMDKQLTGPPLAGAADRWPDEKVLHAWIKNNQKVIKSGYPYAIELYNKFNKTPMNVFEGTLSDQQIDAIIGYIKSYKPPTPAAGTTGVATTETTTTTGDNTLLFGILTLILAIVAFVLMQINA